MVSLIAHARDEQSVELAKRALDICSSIARKNITYRDIRVRRKEIDNLIKELSGTGPAWSLFKAPDWGGARKLLTKKYIQRDSSYRYYSCSLRFKALPG